MAAARTSERPDVGALFSDCARASGWGVGVRRWRLARVRNREIGGARDVFGGTHWLPRPADVWIFSAQYTV